MSLAGRTLTILTEGDARRGLGHISRCGGYAQAWRERSGRVRWIVDGDDLARRLLGDEADVAWRAWQVDAGDLNESEAILVDSYSVDAATAAALAEASVATAFVDDLFRDVYPADARVVHASPGPLPRQASAWLTGPAWHPMRRAFWDMAEREATRARLSRILVTAGGADSGGVTRRMVTAARAAAPDARIDVVLGAASPDPGDSAGVTVHRGLSAEAMRDLMLDCDAALTAAGQTLYELARCGCPAVLVGVAENQRRHMTHWPETGAGLAAGWSDDPVLEGRLVEALASLTAGRRDLMSRAGRALIDGQGCRRLVAELERTL